MAIPARATSLDFLLRTRKLTTHGRRHRLAQWVDPIVSSTQLAARAGLLADDLSTFVAGADLLVREQIDLETALNELDARIPPNQRAIYSQRLREIAKQLATRRK